MLLLAAAQAIAYIDRANLAVIAPYLIREYGYSAAEAGLLVSVFNYAFTASVLFAGPFTDWVRPRISFPLGVGTWSLGTALCSVTQAFAPLAAFLALLGIGESAMIPSGSRVIRETFDKKHRAAAVGAFFAGNKVGLTLGIPLASFLIVNLGWPSVFLTTGALGFVWIALWLAAYRAPPREPESVTRADTQPPIGWLTLLGYRTTWGVMLGQAGYLYIYYVFATWLPGYLELQRNLSTSASGIIGMLVFFIGTTCVILGGWIGDRLIARGARVTLVRKGFAVGGLLGATLFTIAGAYTADTTIAVTLIALAVASVSFSTAAVNAMPIDVAPPHIVSSLVSMQNFGGNLGGSFAPVVTGALVTATGDFTVPLLTAAAVALVFGCGAYGLIVGNLDKELERVAAMPGPADAVLVPKT